MQTQKPVSSGTARIAKPPRSSVPLSAGLGGFRGKAHPGDGGQASFATQYTIFLPASVLANIFRGDNRYAGALFGRYAGAVDAGPKSGYVDPVHPGVDVSFLFWQHAAAFFLIQKNNRAGGKALALRCGNGCLAVGFAQLGCIRDGFQLGQESSVKQNQKTKPCGLQSRRFPVQVFIFAPGGWLSQKPA